MVECAHDRADDQRVAERSVHVSTAACDAHAERCRTAIVRPAQLSGSTVEYSIRHITTGCPAGDRGTAQQYRFALDDRLYHASRRARDEYGAELGIVGTRNAGYTGRPQYARESFYHFAICADQRLD
jgi:hypothetical protein